MVRGAGEHGRQAAPGEQVVLTRCLDVPRKQQGGCAMNPSQDERSVVRGRTRPLRARPEHFDAARTPTLRRQEHTAVQAPTYHRPLVESELKNRERGRRRDRTGRPELPRPDPLDHRSEPPVVVELRMGQRDCGEPADAPPP